MKCVCMRRAAFSNWHCIYCEDHRRLHVLVYFENALSHNVTAVALLMGGPKILRGAKILGPGGPNLMGA